MATIADNHPFTLRPHARPGVPDTSLRVTGRTAAATRYLLAGIRIALGWVFLWAFLDKLFGLGRALPPRTSSWTCCS